MVRKVIAFLAAMTLVLAFALRPAPAVADAALSVYYANWSFYTDDDMQVKNLPWAHIDVINHAFWEIYKANGQFAVRSTDEWADAKHFAQYEAMTEQYPGTRVMLSIGGWTRCGYFSEMALTADSRAQFIASCVDTLRTYPFLGGIDIDWEYPGVKRAGAGNDQGNPVLGDDYANYTLLLKEMRAALNEAFGESVKHLTVCAGGSAQTLKKQDYAALWPYVNRVNLMTYDLAGAWDGKTGHHAALYGAIGADAAVRYLLSKGVSPSAITIGTPLYAHGWRDVDLTGDLVGARASGGSASGQLQYRDIARLPLAQAGEKGWHEGYDEAAQAAYLWNDDPSSADYRRFLSYESARSLDAKLKYIQSQSLGGLIVWEASGDADHFPMLTRMAEALHR